MSIPDILIMPPFRYADDKGPDWTLIKKFLDHENPAMSKMDKVNDALQRLTDRRRVLLATCDDSTCTSVTESGAGSSRITEAFLNGPLREYMELLSFAQAHLPLNGGRIKNLCFSWRYPGKWGRLVSNNSAYEFVSILATVASCFCRVGKGEIIRNGVNGAKSAFKMFQAAAGAIERMTTAARGLDVTDRALGTDLSEAALAFQLKLYLTFAHHSALIKAELETPGKALLLSKLAMTGANAYNDAANLAKTAGRNDGYNPPGINYELYCQFAAMILEAKAHFLIAKDHIEKQEMGAAIGRCNSAKSILDQAANLKVSVPEKQWLTTVRQSIDGVYETISKENRLIYNDRVINNPPPPDALPNLLGKPTPFDTIFTVKEQDPFFGIVPLHVLDIVKNHREKVALLVQQATESFSAHRRRINDGLQAIGAREALQTLQAASGGGGGDGNGGVFPAGLREKILLLRGVDRASVAAYSDAQSGNAIENLVNRIDHINEVGVFCRTRVTGLEEKMDKDEHNESVMRENYGNLWTRPPPRQTDEGGSIRKKIAEFKDALSQHSDGPCAHIKAKLNENLQKLCKLDWSINEIRKLIPISESRSDNHDATYLATIRDALNTIESNGNLGDQKAAELRVLVDSDEVAHQLSSTPPEGHEALLNEARRSINSQIAVLSTYMNSSDQQLVAVQETMMQYTAERSRIPAVEEAGKVFSALAESISIYEEALRVAETVGKFIDEITEKIDSVSSNADSFLCARKMEMDDLRLTLDANIARRMQIMNDERLAKELNETRQRQDELRAQLAMLGGGAQQQQQQQQPMPTMPQPSMPYPQGYAPGQPPPQPTMPFPQQGYPPGQPPAQPTMPYPQQGYAPGQPPPQQQPMVFYPQQPYMYNQYMPPPQQPPPR